MRSRSGGPLLRVGTEAPSGRPGDEFVLDLQPSIGVLCAFVAGQQDPASGVSGNRHEAVVDRTAADADVGEPLEYSSGLSGGYGQDAGKLCTITRRADSALRRVGAGRRVSTEKVSIAA